MKDKTTKELFTKEFIDNLKFLIKNWDIVERYEQSITLIYYYDPLHGTKCDRELEQLAEKYEDLFAEVNQQINDYYNTDFTELFDFLYKNQSTSYYDLEAKLIKCLEYYIS